MAANNVAFACYTPLCRYSKIAANASIVYWNVMPWAVVPVALAGVADVAGGTGPDGRSVMDTFVKALAGHTVTGLRGEDADLEAIFLRYYADDGGTADQAGAAHP